jgi:hypothetical protein
MPAQGRRRGTIQTRKTLLQRTLNRLGDKPGGNQTHHPLGQLMNGKREDLPVGRQDGEVLVGREGIDALLRQGPVFRFPGRLAAFALRLLLPSFSASRLPVLRRASLQTLRS